MTFKTLRKILNATLVLIGIFWVIFFMKVLVYGDYLKALPIMEAWERKNLLSSPPAPASFFEDLAKTEIKHVKNSEGLRAYIEQTIAPWPVSVWIWEIFTILFPLCLIARLYFRKRKFGDNTQVACPFSRRPS